MYVFYVQFFALSMLKLLICHAYCINVINLSNIYYVSKHVALLLFFFLSYDFSRSPGTNKIVYMSVYTSTLQ